MNAYCYSIQLGFKPQLNKIWAQIRQGAFDSIDLLKSLSSLSFESHGSILFSKSRVGEKKQIEF
ncbi:hypothetical protein J6TS1_37570 [Siminovitchia terrae]|uniref:Uncharacterized protein n=1 Tax=Siminovitchia terrae TaxID=1914933 RepID=A0A429XA39_SIMTE|nr:hypothetical protein [Siminovitchia terrae]RST60270.1 hypothetical protein D5F11_007410 [Siminovitchia terrae]GIN89817.1 hypothetical protein J22TS1_08680 [Siminovitchia terrae]GIN97887.1 hypothetical protein J6TS1_37570 [Siminovitchia terrae]